MESLFDDLTHPDIEAMVEDCNEVMTCNDSPFDDVENEFIEALTIQFYRSEEELTESQISQLKLIWDKI